MNSISALDVRLGIRMLGKYPGLSAISVLSMAVAIAVGAAGFGMFSSFFNTRLPIEESDRLVAIRWARDGGRQQSAADFHMWRAGVSSVPDLAAFSDTRRNLLVPSQTPELIEIAAMTASGFRATRVSALMGRAVLDTDELPTAPPVLLIAYDEWQRRFGADPAIIGREVRLGTVVHTVIGVMPEGFHFPVNHRFWTTLRVPQSVDPTANSSLFVFGRLADSATLAKAQSEVSVIAAQAAAANPATDARHFRARLRTYGAITLDLGDRAFILKAFWQTFVSLLLVVVAVNVAVLVYARTAARAGEIAVRTALGASRGRIIGQLFTEALVLSSVAAVLGLGLASYGLAEIARLVLGGVPYWISFGLSPSMVVYTCVLVVFAAALVGVIPALKGTGCRMQAGLQQFASRGWDLTLGRTWTAMIVVQVAIAVAALPFLVDFTVMTVSSGMTRVHYPIEEFLQVSLSPERAAVSPERASGGKERFPSRVAELMRRLEAEPGVAGVAFARTFSVGGFSDRIEVEEPVDDTRRGVQWAGSNRVDVKFMPVLGVRVLAGRGFTSADAADGATSIVVDRAFAAHFFGTGDALGRRLRVMREVDNREAPGPWLQIVGVVEDFVTGETDFERPTMYRATTLDAFPNAVSLAVRTRANPATMTARVRDMAAAVDPSLQLDAVQPATNAERERQRNMFLMGLISIAVTMSVLMLSAGGIYAMMSFTVVRRRREIGIRSALGADPRRLLASVFARASRLPRRQIGTTILPSPNSIPTTRGTGPGVEWMSDMEVTINLPDDILAALEGRWGNVPRRSLEAIAVEAYRSGALTEGQVRRALKFGTRFQVHALLKAHLVPLRYTAADLEADLAAHRELRILPER